MFNLALPNRYIGYVALIDANGTGPLHPVVLSCGCSQSSEAVRTRRERERAMRKTT